MRAVRTVRAILLIGQRRRGSVGRRRSFEQNAND
jgi:hypothetical protein